MAKGRRPSGTPVERGSLGHSMMSAVAELGPTESAAEQGAESGSDLQTELQKLDRGALSQPAESPHGAARERAAAMASTMPIITCGAAAIILAAMYKAVRGRR